MSIDRRTQAIPEPTDLSPDEPPRRVFLHEPGWRVVLKVGSIREFCYQMEPGQDYYHRLLDGEVYVYHGDEKLCLACAQRRGLLSYQPKTLKDSLNPLDRNFDPAKIADPIALAGGDEFDVD